MKLKKYVEHLKLVFIVISVLIFVAVIVMIFWKNDDVVVTYESAIKQNVLNIEDLLLTYVIDNSSYFKLTSKKGDAAINNYFVNLNNLNLYYSGSSFSIDAQADKGKYELQRKISAYGNIYGKMDNMTFEAGTNGIIEYDYIDGKGIIKNGVTMYQGNNNIKSNKAEFNVKDNFVLFKDNVSVEYSSEEGSEK